MNPLKKYNGKSSCAILHQNFINL